MLLDLIDLSKLRHTIVYALLFAALFVFQDLLLSRITVWGVHAMILPAAVVAIGLFDGGSWGGFMGLAAGYFYDLGYIETTCFFAVMLALAGFFSGVLGKYLLHKGFVSFLALTVVTLIIITICQMFPFLFFSETVSVWPVWRTGLVQILWSIPWCMLVYFPYKSIAGIPARHTDRSS